MLPKHGSAGCTRRPTWRLRIACAAAHTADSLPGRCWGVANKLAIDSTCTAWLRARPLVLGTTLVAHTSTRPFT